MNQREREVGLEKLRHVNVSGEMSDHTSQGHVFIPLNVGAVRVTYRGLLLTSCVTSSIMFRVG